MCVCVSVALFIQHVNLISMCRIILQSAACCAALPFGTLYYKRHEFRRRFIEYKMCVPISSTCFVWNISDSENNLAGIIIRVNRFTCKLFVFVSEFVHNWICRQIFEVFKYNVLLKFLRCELSSFKRTDGRMDGRTDTPNEVNSGFSLSCECV